MESKFEKHTSLVVPDEQNEMCTVRKRNKGHEVVQKINET